jgi:hypothetical protein
MTDNCCEVGIVKYEFLVKCSECEQICATGYCNYPYCLECKSIIYTNNYDNSLLFKYNEIKSIKCIKCFPKKSSFEIKNEMRKYVDGLKIPNGVVIIIEGKYKKFSKSKSDLKLEFS